MRRSSLSFPAVFLLAASPLVAQAQLGESRAPSKDETLLIEAKRGDAAAVQAALNDGAHLEFDGGDGCTALDWAVWNGHPAVLRVLIERGARLRTDCKWSEKARKRAEQERASTRASRRQVGDQVMALLKEGEAKAAKTTQEKTAFEARLLAAEKAGDEAMAAGKSAEAFSHYVDSFRELRGEGELGLRLRAKLIAAAHDMDPPPEIPKEAMDHAIRAGVFFKKVKVKDDYARVIAEYRESVAVAPWWGEGYFNLGVAQEKAGDYDGAIESFQLYLRAAPDSADAQKVEKRITEIGAMKELAAPAKAAPAKANGAPTPRKKW